jgi:hypothetical protein
MAQRLCTGVRSRQNPQENLTMNLVQVTCTIEGALPYMIARRLIGLLFGKLAEGGKTNGQTGWQSRRHYGCREWNRARHRFVFEPGRVKRWFGAYLNPQGGKGVIGEIAAAERWSFSTPT